MPAKVKKGARDLLAEARALVAKGWCQGHFAATRTGKLADIFSAINPPARFCAAGALHRATRNEGWPSPERAAAFVALTAATSRDLIAWNDKRARTKAEVLHAFDKAIRLASAPSSKSKKGKRT